MAILIRKTGTCFDLIGFDEGNECPEDLSELKGCTDWERLKNLHEETCLPDIGRRVEPEEMFRRNAYFNREYAELSPFIQQVLLHHHHCRIPVYMQIETRGYVLFNPIFIFLKAAIQVHSCKRENEYASMESNESQLGMFLRSTE